MDSCFSYIQDQSVRVASFCFWGNVWDATPDREGELFFDLAMILVCGGCPIELSVLLVTKHDASPSSPSLSAGDPLRHSVPASCTALLVATLAFLAWMVRAGVVVNFVSVIGQGFPVIGGMSQSLVNETAGAHSPISGLMASLLVWRRLMVQSEKP